MAITNWNNFIAAGTQTPWYATALEDALKGYKIGKEPEKMAEEQKQRALANSLQEKALAHKDTEYALADQLKQAAIKKSNQPTGLKGALAAAFELRNRLDKNSPTYQKDINAVNNYINKLGTTAGGIPPTEPGQGIKIDLPEGKEGYIPGIGKLKNGWQSVKNEQGQDIGVNVPMSDKQIDQWKAKEKFDVIYPFINDSLSQYTGRNSWENFTRDFKNYNKDESAKQRIDNFYAAKKLISIGSTTENARIGGHATNIQLEELKKTLDSSQVNKKLEKAGEFVLPTKYAKNSGNIFKSYLDKVEKSAKTNIPAYEFRALNPGENNSNNNKIVAPKIPSYISTQEQFQKWLVTLPPEQQNALKAEHVGDI